MSKGKEHKKYEFGAKASVVVGKNGGVILGAYRLPENDYDGHALEPTLEQVDRVAGYLPAVAIGDKGFRGESHCGQTEVVPPQTKPPCSVSPPLSSAKSTKSGSARQNLPQHEPC